MTTVPVTVQERVPMPPGIPRRPPSAGAPTGMAFGDVMRVLKQRVFLIVAIWFLATGATAALTLYLQRYHEQFRAQGIIEVRSQGVRRPMEFDNPTVAVEMLNRWLADEAQYIRQDQVLDKAFKNEAVVATAWYQDGLKEKSLLGGMEGAERLFQKLKDDLDVSPIPQTSYLLVSFPARTRRDAETIVRTIIKEYLGFRQQAWTTDLNRQLADAEKELKALSGKLETMRQDKERYIQNWINTPGVVNGIQVPAEQWRALAQEAIRLEAEQLQLKAQWENLKNLDASQLALSPTLQMNIQQDPQVMALNNAIMGMEQELRSSLGRVGPKHRSIETLAASIAAAEEQRDRIIRQKEREIRQFQLTSAETAYYNALQSWLALSDRVAEFKNEQRDLDGKIVRVKNMEEEQEMLNKQYEGLSGYVQQLGLLASSQETIRVRQVGEAVAPPKRSFPRWELFMPAGSILGLLMGLGLALLLEVASTSIRTPRDLMRYVHIPILGTVPDLDDEEVNIEQIELASHTAPRSMIAEAFRGIRTNLLLSSPAERQRTVLITSSRAEEGKTAVAINLAIAIGQSGRRVLLVDANFHRPALHMLFPKARREGLSNILIGRGRLEELVSPTELPNLDVLTCGPIPPNPAELLSSRYMAELISQATGRYDQVLFDGPPALLVSDATVLASAVDGVILVCRARNTSRGVLQRAREQLERVNARLFGAVLNAAQVARGGYFREQMRSYYDYQPEEALAGGTAKALPSEKTDDTPSA